jgi:uncharacterized RDD family membrane protein YckC
MKIVICSNCGMQVIPRSDGTCPSCQHLLSRKVRSKATKRLISNEVKKPNGKAGKIEFSEVASLPTRIINYVVDTIIIDLVFYMLYKPFISIITSENLALYLFLGFIFSFMYYFLFEYFLQKTPGKYITRTKVFMTDRSKPTSKLVALRTLCRYIPLEVLSFIGSRSRETTWWHDRWFNIRVVYN